eukprot:3937438-Rhodomonas_salina.1
MSGTDIGYAATRRGVCGNAWYTSPIVLRRRYAMSGTDIAHHVIVLRRRYAMSGTDIAHHVIVLRRRYAMSGTDLGYVTTRRLRNPEKTVLRVASPSSCYVMSGTDLGYAPTHTPRDVQYCSRLSPTHTLCDLQY